VKVVTIYAFSIENFKRSKYEVDTLMDMAKVKLSQLSEHGELLDRYGARVRVLGRRELVKPDVLEAVDRAVKLTSRNGDAILNICFPYTSRDEITTAVRNTVIEYSTPLDQSQFSVSSGIRRQFSESHIVQSIQAQALDFGGLHGDGSPYELLSISPSSDDARSSSEADPNVDTTSDPPSSFSSSTTLHQGRSTYHTKISSIESYTTYPPSSDQPFFLSPETITPQTLDDHMFTAGSPPLDLLVRTSGVERLSDFMLWQCHQNTEIVFLETLWPSFDLWTFLPVLWEWQWRVRKLRKRVDDGDDEREDGENYLDAMGSGTNRWSQTAQAGNGGKFKAI
jgi:undecaprenyl pyrophosphate synthase